MGFRHGAGVALWLFVYLLQDAELRAQVQATLRVERNLVIARGHWKPTADWPGESATRKPLAEIHCYRAERRCMEATATSRDGEPGLSVQYYKVVLWDDNGVVAELNDFTCTTNRLIINFRETNVMALDVPKNHGKGLAEPCKSLPASISYRLTGE